VAGKLFAQRGYDGTSIRDICTEAKTNIAAVSYHFGDKMGLYKAVIEFGIDLGTKKFPFPTQKNNEEPQHLLCRQIESLLCRINGTPESRWYDQIVKREILFPQKNIGNIIDEYCIKPDYVIFTATLKLIEPTAPQELINDCVFNLMAILSFQAIPAPYFKRVIFQNSKTKHLEIKEIAQSVALFVVAGLRESVAKYDFAKSNMV
jgi:TetR/AcrR family transcriptional regulator, regulator of cefoperazone and chloramphenicol sensitivity